MAIKYYPSSKIKRNQKALPGEFTLNGIVYSGSYYSTYDGKFFSGQDPITGANQQLFPTPAKTNLEYSFQQSRSDITFSEYQKIQIQKTRTQPVSYYPSVTESDYSRGYFTRYFVKRTNQRGYVMEISEKEFESIRNGTATYDISFYQTVSVIWKLTGPLKSKRISQYQVREGIIDTNKRLVESTSVNFVGLKEFIADDYAKFSRPTE